MGSSQVKRGKFGMDSRAGQKQIPRAVMIWFFLSVICMGAMVHSVAAEPLRGWSGNPVFPGWHADPEGIIIDKKYWIYPTFSAPYDKHLHFDAFSSKDLVKWSKHERVLDNTMVPWVRCGHRALWRRMGNSICFSVETIFRTMSKWAGAASRWQTSRPAPSS